MPGNGYLTLVSDGSLWKVVSGQYVNELAGRRIARWDQIASSGSGAWQTVFYESGARLVEPATAGSGYLRFNRRNNLVNTDAFNFWMGNNYPNSSAFQIFTPIPHGGFNVDSFGGYRENTFFGTVGTSRCLGGGLSTYLYSPPTNGRNNAYSIQVTGPSDPTLYPPHLPGIPNTGIQA
jgi:hypothetical protein